MHDKEELTQKRLRELLYYESTSGNFLWVAKSSPKSNYIKIGDIAGSRDNGCIRIKVHKKSYLAHRLVWLYVYGKFPEKLLDHVDGNRSNNKVDNLREATSAQNTLNQRLRVSNTSGFKGVSKQGEVDKWRAYCSVNGEIIYLWLYDTPEEAGHIREEFAKKNHGEFYRDTTKEGVKT